MNKHEQCQTKHTFVSFILSPPPSSPKEFTVEGKNIFLSCLLGINIV